MVNILFDEESKRITALIDYDFSLIASQIDEYFYSFHEAGGLLAGPGEDDEGILALRQCLLHGFTADDANRTHEFPDWKSAVILDKEFAKAGVVRPQGKYSRRLICIPETIR